MEGDDYDWNKHFQDVGALWLRCLRIQPTLKGNAYETHGSKASEAAVELIVSSRNIIRMIHTPDYRGSAIV